MMITIAATHHRRQTFWGSRVGDSTQKSLVELGHVSCPEEAIVRAWTYAVTALREQQAPLRFIVQCRLLEGYLRLNWRVRSLPMLRALRDFARAAQDVSVEFIYRTEADGRANARWGHK